jgi:hypothetical protein
VVTDSGSVALEEVRMHTASTRLVSIGCVWREWASWLAVALAVASLASFVAVFFDNANEWMHLFALLGVMLVVVPLTLVGVWWPPVGGLGFIVLAAYIVVSTFPETIGLGFMWPTLQALAVGSLFLVGGGSTRHRAAQSWLAALVPLAAVVVGWILW